MCGIDTDEWQVPVRFAWVILSYLFEDRKEVAADGRRDRALQNLANRFFFGVHIRRKPERRTSEIVGAVGSAV
jgi:hypothetical protein